MKHLEFPIMALELRLRHLQDSWRVHGDTDEKRHTMIVNQFEHAINVLKKHEEQHDGKEEKK